MYQNLKGEQTMKIKIVGKNITVTEGIRTKITEKLSKLDRYDFLKENAEVNVLIRTVKNDQIIEVTIPLDNKKMIRAEKRSNDLYAAVDLVEETLAKQIRRMKEKVKNKKKTVSHYDILEESTEKISIKQKNIQLDCLTVAEAIDDMESLDHDFHLFMNVKTGTPSVVYRRKEGGYGVIAAMEE